MTLLSCVFVAALALTQPQAGTGVLLDDGVASFVAPGVDRAELSPSLAIIGGVRSIGRVPSGFPMVPEFDRDDDDRYVARLSIEPGTSLYGTGEIAGPLLRNGQVTETWNLDAYGYDETYANLYQSHPWVLGVRADGTSFGVLADTTWRCRIDLTDGIEFAAVGGPYRVIVIDRPSPQEVLTSLGRLIGTIEMPPKWAIGYHQCRYSYYPEARVRELASEFRDRDIPCDVIWFDIDYMRDYRVFTFDPSHFPDPAGLNQDLNDDGFHTIWMIDPGVKAEPGYPIYDAGTAGDHWVKNADGSVYYGDVWPGRCVFPDYTRPETREWWADLYGEFMATGIDGVWNDMNEPAIFNVKTKTMPENNMHRGGGGLDAGSHAQYHNVYGMLMVKASRDGIMAANPEKRPFVLTRASYMGGHRYAATWTGDNSAEWDDLEASVPMILNLGMSGQPFCGPDIGGFNGNGDGEMFARWMAVGAMFPFSRGHTGKGNIDKEPWAFDEAVEATCRAGLQRRYRLMPYFYTLFHEAATTGLPIMRPLFFADPADPALRSEDDAFLIGQDVLVIPRLTPEGDRTPVLPKGDWREFRLLRGLYDDALPTMKIRAGAIVPIGPVTEHVDEKPLDPLTLLVCPDKNGKAEGWLYEDAGDGYGYRKGDYLMTRYEARQDGDVLVVKIAETRGNMPRPDRQLRVRTITGRSEVTVSGRDGSPIKVLVTPANRGY